MNSVTFLLGAGASIPAGYSSTEKLTDKILASEGYFRHTDERYIRGTAGVLDYETPVVRRTIRWLLEQTQGYFQCRGEIKEPNYEDIYYLASQLRDEAAELPNPALLPLVCKLKCEMMSWPEYKNYCEGHPRKNIFDPVKLDLSFKRFSSETCNYIEDIVSDVLNYNGKCCTKHLEIIKAIHRTDGLKLKGIATLAHDTHVEMNLRSAGIKLADGFCPAISGDSLRIWKNKFSSSDAIPFIKLHGSVNWIRFELPEQRTSDSKCEKLPLSEIGVVEPSYLENSVYTHHEGENRRPFLLIGTFNKPVKYNWGFMLDIHHRKV